MKYLLFGFFTISLTFARVHDFNTTRLNSTAGAGVGSILVTEGGMLNPATLAIFNYSSLHIQKTESKTKSKSALNTISEEGTSTALIYTDSKSKLKGALGYFKQEEDQDRRKRFSLSMSKALGKRSSYGVTYRYTTDHNRENRFVKDKYHQAIIGFSHVLSTNLSMGAIVIDPSGEKAIDRKVVIGLQYTMKDILSFMLDAGTDYEEDPSDTLNYSAAVQIRVMDDIYLRAGLFNNRKLQEKGNGIGIGWASPKFLLEVSSKLTEPLVSEITNDIAYRSRQRETAMSLTMRF